MYTFSESVHEGKARSQENCYAGRGKGDRGRVVEYIERGFIQILPIDFTGHPSFKITYAIMVVRPLGAHLKMAYK